MILGLLALAALIAAPFFFYPILLMSVLCFALFACAFNLLIGYVGFSPSAMPPSLAARLISQPMPPRCGAWKPLAAILLGVAAPLFLGAIIGFLAIRRQGIYFAMITLALGQMFAFICLQVPFTHGEDGIQGVPRGYLLGFIDLNEPMTMYYVTLAIFLGRLFRHLAHREFAIRQHPQGHSRKRKARDLTWLPRGPLQARCFRHVGRLAGLAGGTKAIVFQFATLTDVQWQMSGEVILMTLLGGIGTLIGPVVGAGLVIALQNYLAASDFPVTVLIGIIFVICVLLFRRGIVGEVMELLTRRGSR